MGDKFLTTLSMMLTIDPETTKDLINYSIGKNTCRMDVFYYDGIGIVKGKLVLSNFEGDIVIYHDHRKNPLSFELFINGRKTKGNVDYSSLEYFYEKGVLINGIVLVPTPEEIIESILKMDVSISKRPTDKHVVIYYPEGKFNKTIKMFYCEDSDKSSIVMNRFSEYGYIVEHADADSLLVKHIFDELLLGDYLKEATGPAN